MILYIRIDNLFNKMKQTGFKLVDIPTKRYFKFKYGQPI